MAPNPSWVSSANLPGADFPLNNLPYGVFSVDGGARRCGVAIGDSILDLTGLEAAGCLSPGNGAPLFPSGRWNEAMAAGPDIWAGLRTRLTELLADGSDARDRVAGHLVKAGSARMHLPFEVSEFTDFYASRDHATNVGTMFRGAQNALPANWLHIPIGYNGRASSVVVSGTPVRRPWGQVRPEGSGTPVFAPSSRWDFELELGAVVGQPSQGPVSVADADAMIFGYVLLNDWSARDIQAWEYQPLGPFQGKATATTISPWIVSPAALAPFRRPTPPRAEPLLPYLSGPGPGLFDIALEVELRTQEGTPTTITRTNYATMYYSAAQQLAHHASCGCPMRTGDLLGSGTISGPARENRGSLLELSWGGTAPLRLSDGQTRTFIEDGDTIVLRGAAQGDGYRIGFGACAGTTLPAAEKPDWA